MLKFIVLALTAVALGSCAGVPCGEGCTLDTRPHRGHIGGVLAPLFKGTILDPEVIVSKPAECFEEATLSSETVQSYGDYRRRSDGYSATRSFYHKECSREWLSED